MQFIWLSVQLMWALVLLNVGQMCIPSITTCTIQYGDRTSAMGNSDLGTCYNAPQAHSLQWIQPQVVTKAMLPQGRVVSFTLNGSTRGGLANGQPGRVGLMIRSWADSAWLVVE